MTLEHEDIWNESEYQLTDISSETVRRYDFGGVDTEITDPIALAVSDNGHRIVDASGVIHYVGYDGFYFNWETADGEPHLVK